MTIIQDLILSASTSSATSSHWVRRRASAALKIEKVALELFLDRGPENVTVEEIAKNADISRRTFFRYFRTKEELLAAMPTRQMVASTQAVCERPINETLIEAILATTQSITFSDEEMEIIALSQQIMIRFPDYWAQAAGELRVAMDSCYEFMIGYRFQLQGRDEANVGLLAAALTAIVVYVYTEWVDQQNEDDFASKLKKGFDAFSELDV